MPSYRPGRNRRHTHSNVASTTSNEPPGIAASPKFQSCLCTATLKAATISTRYVQTLKRRGAATGYLQHTLTCHWLKNKNPKSNHGFDIYDTVCPPAFIGAHVSCLEYTVFVWSQGVAASSIATNSVLWQRSATGSDKPMQSEDKNDLRRRP